MRIRLVPAVLVLVGSAGCGDNTDGRCDGLQPVATFVASQTGRQVAGLTSDQDYLYWTEADGVAIYRRSKLGGAVETFANEQSTPYDLVADDTSLFWLTRDGAVHAADKSTRSVSELVPAPSPIPQDAFHASLRGSGAVLVRWNSATRAVEKIAKSDGSSTTLAYTSWGGTAVNSDAVYWTDVTALAPFGPVSLRVMRLAGQAVQPELIAELGGDALPLETRLDAGTLYVSALTRTEGIGQISGIASDGTVTFFAEGDTTTIAFAVDAGRVYYKAHSRLMRATAAEMSATTLACVSDTPLVMLADEALYWGAHGISRFDE